MTLRLDRSSQWFSRAQRLMPGGVSSPVRAFGAVGGTPPFLVRGEGAYVEDADGNRYIDYVGSWGALICGHADPAVVEAAVEAVRCGSSFGASTPWEVELAEVLCEAVPSLEMVRFVSSGTEAVMSALRAARAATGREEIVKFDGCYHGHADSLLVQAGSGLATLRLGSSAGVPASAVAHTVSLPYNDVLALEEAFERFGKEVAAVVVEPVAGNMGVVPATREFLEALRDLTVAYGALLIFDEVITGFRVAWGGAQAAYDIRPDLTCLGKIVGGGFPLAAYGGRRDVMSLVAPAGPVYQAGTLAGNPVAVRAGLATLRRLREPGTYERLDRFSSVLAEGLRSAAEEAGVPVQVNRVASMLTVFFTDRPVTDYESAQRSDGVRYAQFFWGMLRRGVMLPPSPFEAMFVSLAHGEEEIGRTVEAARAAMREVR
jgi:glutamate-1-semialdehyde 2,1-aminomutase